MTAAFLIGFVSGLILGLSLVALVVAGPARNSSAADDCGVSDVEPTGGPRQGMHTH